MDILVFGAGVCGSYIASELFLSGQNVTVLARGERLKHVRENGIMIRHPLQKSWTTAAVPVIDMLRPDAYFDLVLVAVRHTDLDGVIPSLAGNKKCPFYIFLGNNVDIRGVSKRFSDASRLAFGFPPSGGHIEKGIVYSYHKNRPVLTLGETLGRESTRLYNVADAFHETPVRVAVSPNIDAWLKYRIALVNPLISVIQSAGGDLTKLARDDKKLNLFFEAAKEGIKVLEELHYPDEPSSTIRLMKMHSALLAPYFRHQLLSGAFGPAVREQAMTEADEMAELADEFMALRAHTSAVTPALDELYAQMERSPQPLNV